MSEMEVHQHAAMIPISQEQLDDAAGDAEAFRRWISATPEERAQWMREAAERRAAERATATPVALTLDALLDKLGFSREYAEHLVQPYCDCGDGSDGWDYCMHARDLGLWRG